MDSRKADIIGRIRIMADDTSMKNCKKGQPTEQRLIYPDQECSSFKFPLQLRDPQRCGTKNLADISDINCHL